MKRQFFQQKKYPTDMFSMFGLVDLLRFCVLISLLSLSDLVSVSLGNIADFSEWLMMLDDGLLIESIGLSLLSALLINPVLIEKIWHVFYFLIKVLCRLFLSRVSFVFVTPSLRCFAHSAHGCRAPPISL